MGKIGGNYLITPDALHEADSRDNQKLNLYQIGVEYLKKNIPCLNDEDNWKSFESSYFVAPSYSSVENAFFEIPNSMYSSLLGKFLKYGKNEAKILEVLHGDSSRKICDCYYVHDTYGDNYKKFLFDLKKKIGFKIPDDYQDDKQKRNSWVKFSKLILNAADFISKFDSYESLVSYCQKDTPDERFSLAETIARQKGAGTQSVVMTLNWLKDIGIPDYCKPDIHLCRIVTGVFKNEYLTKGEPYTTINEEEWLSKLPEYYRVKKDAFIKSSLLANEADVTLFAFDRLMFLIGSGNFYGTDELSQQMRTEYAERVRGADKDERFINYALSHL